MRKMYVFFVVLILSSCNNYSPENSTNNFEVTESLMVNTESSLSEKKFKEFYDLNILLKDYPDFKEDIEKRIDKFMTGEGTIFDINDSIKIENIRQKESLTKLSDSLEMTQILFDIRTKNGIKTDSVYALVTKKKIIIDGKEVVSKKVKFAREITKNF
jgi:predicted patatin/cPLA2 family phospholipase